MRPRWIETDEHWTASEVCTPAPMRPLEAMPFVALDGLSHALPITLTMIFSQDMIYRRTDHSSLSTLPERRTESGRFSRKELSLRRATR